MSKERVTGMTALKVAHIHQQGNDIIIVPLSESFGEQPPNTRKQTIQAMQRAAEDQGLKGTVVPIWPGDETLHFVAPKPWHPFFGSINWQWITGNLNREMTV